MPAPPSSPTPAPPAPQPSPSPPNQPMRESYFVQLGNHTINCTAIQSITIRPAGVSYADVIVRCGGHELAAATEMAEAQAWLAETMAKLDRISRERLT